MYRQVPKPARTGYTGKERKTACTLFLSTDLVAGRIALILFSALVHFFIPRLCRRPWRALSTRAYYPARAPPPASSGHMTVSNQYHMQYLLTHSTVSILKNTVVGTCDVHSCLAACGHGSTVCRISPLILLLHEESERKLLCCCLLLLWVTLC